MAISCWGAVTLFGWELLNSQLSILVYPSLKINPFHSNLCLCLTSVKLHFSNKMSFAYIGKAWHQSLHDSMATTHFLVALCLVQFILQFIFKPTQPTPFLDSSHLQIGYLDFPGRAWVVHKLMLQS